MQSENLKYDFIIVGSGPAGCVIAKTLSDNGKSVLLIEAGENHDDELPIRYSSYPTMSLFPKYYWQGEMLPQENLNNRFFRWTTGRLAGGASSINGQQYVRSTPETILKWSSLLGPIWSYDNVLKAYQQLEKYNGQTTNPLAHGYQGRINIRQTPFVENNITKKFVKAIEEATSLKEILDYNDPNTPIGPFSRWQLYEKPNGFRESASTAFLSSDVIDDKGFGVNGRKLRVLYKATALRVLFNNKNAIGIDLLIEGKYQQAFANKKVIICAGINSTQILMQSGIGPDKILKNLGIEVIYNNYNVGKNLTNHTLNFASFSLNPNDLLEPIDPFALYLGGAFLPSPIIESNKIRRVQLIGNINNGNFQIIIQDLQPESRGYIQIQNNDPLKIVLADEEILSNKKDLEVTKAIYQIYIKNIAEKLFKIDPFYQLISPTLDIINDDQKLEAFIKSNMGHNYHQQSELRMAPLNLGGVVDNKGQVYGVNNLVVADCSIIPYTSDGNTSAVSFMIGYIIANEIMKETK